MDCWGMNKKAMKQVIEKEHGKTTDISLISGLYACIELNNGRQITLPDFVIENYARKHNISLF